MSSMYGRPAKLPLTTLIEHLRQLLVPILLRARPVTFKWPAGHPALQALHPLRSSCRVWGTGFREQTVLPFTGRPPNRPFLHVEREPSMPSLTGNKQGF